MGDPAGADVSREVQGLRWACFEADGGDSSGYEDAAHPCLVRS